MHDQICKSVSDSFFQDEDHFEHRSPNGAISSRIAETSFMSDDRGPARRGEFKYF